MKKTIYNIFSLVITAVMLFSAVSCEELKTEDGMGDTNFPELVENHDVVPGDTLTLTIQPNAAWSISINKESYTWFKIKDGKFDKQTLSGVALSEPKEITIWTTSEDSFDLRSCEITLEIGGESKVIARYTLSAKAKTIEIYKAVRTDEGAFTFAEEEYVYDQTPMDDADEIELVWDNNDKRFHYTVRVVANYNWTVKWPSWARADINVDSKVGETRFQIYGISSELPLEATPGDIVFKYGEDIVKTFKVKIPGCKDIFTYTLGGYTSLNFDHAQYFHNGEGSFTKEPVQGSLYGPAAARVVVLEMTENGYVVPQTPWLNVEVAAWDPIDGADVLQSREVNITAPMYAGKTDRSALIFFLPATAPENSDELLSGDKMSVKEKYAQYVIPVTQSACPDDYFTFEASAADLESAGILFERTTDILADKNLKYADGCAQWQYNLSYVKERAETKSPLYITYPYETIAVFNADGEEIAEADLPEHWLKYNPLGEGLYGQVLMDMTVFTSGAPKEIDGYLVFKDVNGKVLASVHCFYVEEEKTQEDILVDVSTTMFVDPAAAEAAGAKIYELQSGPTYEVYKEHQAPIYVVRYIDEDLSLQIKTSKQCWMYSCVGKKNGPEMVTIDNQMFYDHEYYKLLDDYNSGILNDYPDPNNDRSTMGILTFGETSFVSRSYPGTSSFNMKRPDGVTETSMTETILFGSSSSVLFVFICELDVR